MTGKYEEAVKSLDNFVNTLVFKGDEAKPSNIFNAVVLIASPDNGFSHISSAGLARADTGEAMTGNHQYHIASTGKMMTATVLLQLWEEGFLGQKGLDTTLGDFGLFDRDTLNRLFVFGGKAYGGSLTLRQLLTHSSGMKDIQADDGNYTAEEFGGPAPGSLFASLWSRRDIHLLENNDLFELNIPNWKPWDSKRPYEKEAGLINWLLNGGCAESPVFLPDQGFHYSDTAFTILALLIEHLTGRSFHRVQRERIFDPLGMDSTFMSYNDDPDPAPWTHSVSDFYFGDIPGMSKGINLSNDFGGGGQVSTAEDLYTFLRNLLEGNLFKNNETLEVMSNWRYHRKKLDAIGPDMFHGIGLGIFRSKTRDNTHWVGHAGAWGSWAAYEEESGIYISGTCNQRTPNVRNWAANALATVREKLA